MCEIGIDEDECVDGNVTDVLNDDCVDEGLIGILDVECVDESLIEAEDLECVDVGDEECMHILDLDDKG